MSEPITVTTVYVLQYRKPFDSEWKLDSLHRSRILATSHVAQWLGNDEGYDFKVEEYVL